MSTENFTHLHLHSDHSILDGACKISRLIDRVKSLNMPSVALTDHGNLFGIPAFYKEAKRAGVKPLLGCEIYLKYDGSRLEKKKSINADSLKLGHLVLLAKNLEGYENLTKIVSDAHVNGFYYKARTDLEMVAKYSKGLVALTGCLSGILSQYLLREDKKSAKEALAKYIDIFGHENVFVEMQRNGMEEQDRINPGLVSIAKEFDVKVVATNDVHYVHASDWAAQDALMCIQTGAKVSDENRMRMPTRQFYLKSKEEMLQAFSDIPEALSNTMLVSDMCDVELPFGVNRYPVFRVPVELKDTFPSNEEYFNHLCREGLKARYEVDCPSDKSFDEFASSTADTRAKEIVERLNYELSVIKETGFLDYFLIVCDFINWAKAQGIPVGPGRGSVAGCIVAYLLNITDVDPLRFGLLFERFLNPERVSPPDIDIDFCMRRRDEVLNYVREKYGKDCVANILTFGTFGAKMIVRDLARVHDMPYPEADRLAKMIPDDLKITLEDALKKSSELRFVVEGNPLYQKIFEQGKVIEGMVRNVGTHAAGMIIADKPLTEFIPVTLQEGALTTQYSKDFVEEFGLLKMDFLGLKTLTVLSDTQAFVRKTTDNKDFDIEKTSLEDKNTFKLLNTGHTIGIFQLEAPFVQKIAKKFGLDSVDEISVLSALNRPGPMEWIPTYIQGKNDPDSVEYAHPLLEDLCHSTYGVLVFQEQVMEATRLIAGYTLGGADILRRAMGKKNIKIMDAQREIFIKGAWEKNNIHPSKAEEIFNILAKFAGYGFNKSHSDAYGIIIYRTAYLKANYPVQFMSALLSSELGNADKVAYFIKECARMNIEVLGPDINQSYNAFTPIVGKAFKNKLGQIRFGFAAIKGVGDVAAQSIIKERKNGKFKDFLDFARRVDSKVSNKRVMEGLVQSGAFDSMGVDRGQLLHDLDSVMKEASIWQVDKAKGQASLFDFDDFDMGTPKQEVQFAHKANITMSLTDKLKYEKELLGFYLSGHPLEAFQGLDKQLNSFKTEELNILPNFEPFRLCGVVEGRQKRISKKSNRPWLSFTLSTQEERYDLQLFSEAFENFANVVEDGKLIIVEGKIRKNDDSVRLNVSKVLDAKRSLPGLIKNYNWILNLNEHTEDFLEKFLAHLQSNDGSSEVKVSFYIDENYALEGELPLCLNSEFDFESLKTFKTHPAVYGVEVETREIKVADSYKKNKYY